MDLSIALETLCRIILRAREYETVELDVAPDDAPEDHRVETGEDADDDEGDNPAETELRAVIDDLADDEQAEVVALAMIGRGDFEAVEWADALDAAAQEIDDAAGWILEQPTFSTDLESGMAAFDLSCDGLGTVV